MILEESSPNAATAQATETNSTTAGVPEGDSMEIFKASLALMAMHHAGNRAEWHKDLRDAEKYDPFMFGALQRDQTQQYVMLPSNGREVQERKEASPVSDSETQSEGSSASTILLAENERGLDGQGEGDAGNERNEEVDEEMTEDEAENPSADGDGTEGDKLSNPGQEDDEMVDSELHPSGEAVPDDVEPADSRGGSTKKRSRKKAWKARPRKGRGRLQRVPCNKPEQKRRVSQGSVGCCEH